MESQQEQAETRSPTRPPMTEREQRLVALELSRKHILDEIQASSNPRFHELKQKALHHLEEQITALRQSG